MTTKQKRLRKRRLSSVTKAYNEANKAPSEAKIDFRGIFVTPVDYRRIPKVKMVNGKPQQSFIDTHVGYLFGGQSDLVAEKLGICKSYRTDGGIWIISKRLWKAARRMGVELATDIDPDVVKDMQGRNATSP